MKHENQKIERRGIWLVPGPLGFRSDLHSGPWTQSARNLKFQFFRSSCFMKTRKVSNSLQKIGTYDIRLLALLS